MAEAGITKEAIALFLGALADALLRSHRASPGYPPEELMAAIRESLHSHRLEFLTLVAEAGAHRLLDQLERALRIVQEEEN